MELVAPVGPVYQAGTLSGNPVAMAAGLTQLKLLENRDIYEKLEVSGRTLAEGLRGAIKEAGVSAQVNQVGSLLTLFFTPDPVTSYAQAQATDRTAFGAWYRGLLAQGVYAAPSQFEAMFLSAAHTHGDLEQIIAGARQVLTHL
jgi:glutamate-1-semialdehyde 2,1-aminomutase